MFKMFREVLIIFNFVTFISVGNLRYVKANAKVAANA